MTHGPTLKNQNFFHIQPSLFYREGVSWFPFSYINGHPFWNFKFMGTVRNYLCCPDVHRSTTTIEVCYSLNTFIFAMDNLRLDLYGNINHYAKTNFFHTCCRALRCHFFRYQYDTDTFLIYKFNTDTILILSWSEISILMLILIPSRAKNRYRCWYFHIKLWY